MISLIRFEMQLLLLEAWLTDIALTVSLSFGSAGSSASQEDHNNNTAAAPSPLVPVITAAFHGFLSNREHGTSVTSMPSSTGSHVLLWPAGTCTSTRLDIARAFFCCNVTLLLSYRIICLSSDTKSLTTFIRLSKSFQPGAQRSKGRTVIHWTFIYIIH